jgi:hypothetical protein
MAEAVKDISVKWSSAKTYGVLFNVGGLGNRTEVNRLKYKVNLNVH